MQRQRQEKQKQACLQFILVYCLHSVVLASLNVPLELSWLNVIQLGHTKSCWPPHTGCSVVPFERGGNKEWLAKSGSCHRWIVWLCACVTVWGALLCGLCDCVPSSLAASHWGGQGPIWTLEQRDVMACSDLCAVWHVLCTCVACSPCISHKGEAWPDTYMDTRAMEVHTKWVGSEKCYFAHNTINGTLSMCVPTQQTPYIWGTHNMKGTRYQALWCEL